MIYHKRGGSVSYHYWEAGFRKGIGVTEGKFEKCIRAMNRGNREGLKEIYEEYVSYIYSIVRSILSDRDEAEDVTCEFFIRLWEKSDSYRHGSTHKGWMATIARNLAIDALRKRQREEVVDFQDTDPGEDSARGKYVLAAASLQDGTDVEKEVIGDFTVKEALAMLPEAEREIVHLKIMGDMTFQEISGLLGVPMGTVTWRYREAIKKLRRYGYEGSEDGI